MIFSNPPLVELIAELRWLPIPVGSTEPATQGTAGILQLPVMSPHLEETFTRFSNEVAAIGFGMSERVVPIGFPYLPSSVVYRFRKRPLEKENFLYQIGPGVFSANALPPYRQWESFRPIVHQGVQALLAARHPSENSEFTRIALRYIDLFSEEFTNGKSSFQFINEMLGIKLDLPNVLVEQAMNVERVESGLQLSIPLKIGLTMSLTLQDGTVAGKSGIVMNTEVFTVQPTSPYIFQVMEKLDLAHTSIRQTFVGLTKSFHAKMNPVN